MSAEKTNTAVLILAAGGSARFGSPKMLVQWKSKTLLEHVVSTGLEFRANRTVIVAGQYAPEIMKLLENQPVEVVQNPNWEAGIASSLVLGIKILKSYEQVLVLLGDQPFVSGTHLNKLLVNLEESGSMAAATQYPDGLGAPCAFHSNIIPKLLELKGDIGAKQILKLPSLSVVSCHPDWDLSDIDTRDAYENLKPRDQ